MKNCNRIFVYGTLRRGESNHHYLAHLPLLGVHRTPARYTLLDLEWYPGAIAGGHTAIVGELYPLDARLLARLDRLEGYPHEYTRECIPTPHGPAWIYLYRHAAPGAPVIAGGDWRLGRRARLKAG